MAPNPTGQERTVAKPNSDVVLVGFSFLRHRRLRRLTESGLYRLLKAGQRYIWTYGQKDELTALPDSLIRCPRQ
jgi:hypothetical protein